MYPDSSLGFKLARNVVHVFLGHKYLKKNLSILFDASLQVQKMFGYLKKIMTFSEYIYILHSNTSKVTNIFLNLSRKRQDNSMFQKTVIKKDNK